MAIRLLQRLEAGAGLGDDLGHACLADLERRILPADTAGRQAKAPSSSPGMLF